MTARAAASPGALRSDARGAISLELAIALLPVLLLAGWAWQLLEFRAAELVVQRAAAAAARAASVVLPDDPAFYAGEAPDCFGGARKAQVELAAALVLASTSQFRAPPVVELSADDAGHAIRARVSARFEGWLGSAWPGAASTLAASVTLPYQGARYRY